jgi:hypothetical protein
MIVPWSPFVGQWIVGGAAVGVHDTKKKGRGLAERMAYCGIRFVTPTAAARARSISSDIGMYSPRRHSCA